MAAPSSNRSADVYDNPLIIDTHVGVGPKTTAMLDGKTYYGTTCWEHSPSDSEAVKRSRPWSSLDNNTSFWITEPSLVTFVAGCGVHLRHEHFRPQSFAEASDRVTYCGQSKARREEFFSRPSWKASATATARSAAT